VHSMISWTVLSVATNWRLKSLFLILCFWAGGVHAAPSAKSLLDTLKSLPGVSQVCAKRLDGLTEMSYLQDEPKVVAFFESDGVKTKDLEGAVEEFSHDLLIRLTLFFEQDILSRCELRLVKEFTSYLKKAYLSRMGVNPDWYTVGTRDLVFRGLLLPADQTDKVKARIKTIVRKVPAEVVVLKAFEAQAVTDVQGVVVVVPRGELMKPIAVFLKELCGITDRCDMWDGRFLKRLILVEEKGIAAYLPEVGIMVASAELFEKLNTLNRLVLFHEFAHVAQRRAKALRDQDWRAEYFGFSNWKQDERGGWWASVRGTEEQWNDELTKDSANSPFSILPDSVYVGEKTFDGLAMAKSYRESLARKDPSEEMADHIALFRVFPSRFCWKGKPIAPQKYAWIKSKQLFREITLPSCMTTKKP
jgi:hypothetical protein